MDIVFLLIGLIIGGIAVWFIASSRVRNQSVSKTELQHITDKFNETSRLLSVEEEKTRRLETDVKSIRDEYGQTSTENTELRSALASRKAELDSARDLIEGLREEMAGLKKELKTLQEENREVHKNASEATATNKALQEKLETQRKEVEDMAKKFNLEFENIANKILDEKSKKFTTQNKDNLENILKPLGENIDAFKKKIDDVYVKEAKERFSLGQEVKKLMELNQQISTEAQNLTNALKGSSKTQGDWGQMILENILEQSGLSKDREYFVQEFLKDEQGNYIKNEAGKKLQPDVIIAYPDNRKVIIDSKVSLISYTRYCETDSHEIQQRELKEHLKSIKRHIDDLSAKSYQDFAPSLDFVMMFIPNEPAYLLALQNDPDLWHYAYSRRILLISPTNLIAALKLIADLWKREYQSQNAVAIAERGAALYDKFVGFVESLTAIGTNLDRSQKSYESALGQLKDGRGNLINQAKKLRDLGVKTKKNLPSLE